MTNPLLLSVFPALHCVYFFGNLPALIAVSYTHLIINNNGEIYVIKKNGSYYEELYRLDFQNVKWVYVTTLLIKPYYFNALSDGTSIMLFSGNADTSSGGYEKINPYQINYANRTTTNMTYNTYKMPTSTSVTTYGPAGQKKTKTSTATYDVHKNLLSQTDALGRQTTYTYDTGTPGSGHYHLPTQIVQNVGTDKEVTTTNTPVSYTHLYMLLMKIKFLQIVQHPKAYPRPFILVLISNQHTIQGQSIRYECLERAAIRSKSIMSLFPYMMDMMAAGTSTFNIIPLGHIMLR